MPPTNRSIYDLIVLLTSFFRFHGPQFVFAGSVSGTPAQTFNGIGGSGAWWPIDIYNFPDDVRQNISRLLFSAEGLSLSSYRYNVGAGGVNVGNPARAPETFFVSPGVYDYSKDQQGQYFLREAAQYQVSITAFANSAPPLYTTGNSSCNSDFQSGSGNAYGAFLADVILHFRSQGISISYVSAMNEPDNSFGPVPCSQEGMRVFPWDRAEVVNGLYHALAENNLTSSVGILADETSWLVEGIPEYSFWLPQVKDKIAAVVHHEYDFPSDAGYAIFQEIVHGYAPGIPVWMTEICCGLGSPDGSGHHKSGGYDPTIDNALMFSNLIFQSFVIGNEQHFSFWTLLSSELGCDPVVNSSCVTQANPNGWNDGLIYYDPSYATNRNYQLYIGKQFWTYKHFSNFVRPGSQRRPIEGSDVNDDFTMAVSDSSKYYILAMNPYSADTSLTLTFPDPVCAKTGFRTSASEDFAEIAAAASNGTGWSMVLKSLSLTTYIFGRSCF